MGLEDYERKRRFDVTPEPPPDVGESPGPRRFVVQKHGARRLHYDFRLEWGGVLWSWAVPKGPSVSTRVRRLAMRTEDHPVSYADFEGLIPEEQYGAGPVVVWDRGSWEPVGDPEAGLRKGHLTFRLHGERLKGEWHLIRTEGRGDRESWLLIKRDDAHAGGDEPVERFPGSVVTGRTLEQVKADPARLWQSTSAAPDPSGLRGAKEAPMPDLLEPQLLTAVEALPDEEGWIHEIKHDGHRILARLDHGRVRLLSRNGNDWTARLPTIAEAVGALPIFQGWLDGEIVVLKEDGTSDFPALQQALGEKRSRRLRYLVFDLPYVDGHDLRDVPLLERKRALRAVLEAGPGGIVQYLDHIEGHGRLFADQACRLGLEGAVSKRADAPYRSGRGRSWQKMKCLWQQELVVVGFRTSTHDAKSVGSLVLGAHRAGALVPVGHVGTGFTERQRKDLYRTLSKMRVERSPVGDREPEVCWVRPELVVEVAFNGWTGGKRLRQTSFRGVREDRDPAGIRVEPPSHEAALEPSPPARKVLEGTRFTNPERVFWPDAGITKADLAYYYAAVAEHVLPDLVNRPLTIIRCPSGIDGECFFQKHEERKVRHVRQLRIPGEDEPLFYVEDLEGLLALVQLGALEIHPWGARVGTLEHPDRLIWDLDPDPKLPWGRVAEAAFLVKEQLDAHGLRSFVRTTGGKGLHVVVPLAADADWEVARAFAREVADAIVEEDPKRFTGRQALERRGGRIYLDVLRNAPGSTAIGSWVTRRRPGAPVAVPVAWEEIAALGSGARFTIRNVAPRLDLDPWPGFGELAQPLPLPV